MTTKLTKPVSRQIEIDGQGCFVVPLMPEGVSIRKFRKRRAVFLTWRQLAKFGLEAGGYSLTEEQWAAPLKTIAKLRRLPRHGRRQKS